MMGPMGTLLGVLAGELWLVAGEDTGDDSLLSEDPMEREHRSSGATSPPCCPLYPHVCNSRTLTGSDAPGWPGREGPSNTSYSVRSSAPKESGKQRPGVVSSSVSLSTGHLCWPPCHTAF